MLSPRILAAAIGCPLTRAQLWARDLDAAMRRWLIDTPQRQAAFLAQIAHESDRLFSVVESTSYTTPERIVAIFPRHFDNVEQAKPYVRNPMALANRVYANRMGNGDEASGDGWKYRGRGLIQITGHDNYLDCAKGINQPLLVAPQLLEQHEHAAASAAWYWSRHGCNELADAGEFRQITRAINGGMNGIDDRLALWGSCKKALGLI